MKMKRKITTWVVVVIFALLFGLPMLFQGKIAEIVKYEANSLLTARLDFEDLDISLIRHFPHATVELDDLKLVSGVEPFVGDTIVAADRIEVVVNLMSLFGDEGFEVTKVFLKRPMIRAEKCADGHVNWDVMKPSDDPQEEEDPEAEEKEEGGAFRMQVRDFRLDEAQIRYRDDSLKMSFETDPLSLRLSGDMSADETDLRLKMQAEKMLLRSGGVTLLNRTEAEIDADIVADLKNGKFTLSDNLFRLNAIALRLDGWVELADKAVSMDLRAGCDKVMFKDVLSLIPAFYTRDFNDLQAGGSLAMNLWAKGELTDKNLPQFELTTSVENGSFRYASLPKSVSNINVVLAVKNPGGAMDRTVVDLSRFGMALDQNSVSATLYATNLMSDPYVRTSLNGTIDLGAVKMVYPLSEEENLEGRITADVKFSGSMSALQKQLYEKLSAEGQFVVEGVNLRMKDLPEVAVSRAAATITPKAMTLGELNVKVGRSDISANGQLSNYLAYVLRDETLSGRLYVKSSMLDLNEFMTPEEDAPAEEEIPAEKEAASSEPMSVIEVPANLDLSLSTNLDAIKLQRMNISDVGGEVRVKNGSVDLNGLHLNIFEGKATASGTYSTADPVTPRLNLALAFTDASFHKTFEELEMIQKLVPIFAKTGGNYSMTMKLSTRLGQDMTPDLQSLNASGSIRSANIEVQQLEVFDQMAKLLKNDNLRKIRAKDVCIKFAIKNGRIATEPFDLKMGAVKINLAGSTGLDQTIDYTARVSFSASKAIPVKISGTFSKPKLGLDVSAAIDEAKGKAYDKINDLTGGKLPARDLEARAAQIRETAKKAGDKLVVAAQKQRQKMIDGAAGKKRFERKLAEKAGDKLVEEAESQAAKLMQEAEDKIAKMNAE